ncbi:hypothetical protein [Brevibacillus brevis]|uniref:hypothetical protein n=1 Tax=Brevibacillus brevis TaxID=1393 RepID=UPI0013A6B4ED|nr:hypothetical protein [Brevibacillus brevis]
MDKLDNYMESVYSEKIVGKPWAKMLNLLKNEICTQIEKTPRTYRHKGFRLLVSSHVLLALPIVNACAEHNLGFQSVLIPPRNRIKSTVSPIVVSNDIKSFHHFVGDLWVGYTCRKARYNAA